MARMSILEDELGSFFSPFQCPDTSPGGREARLSREPELVRERSQAEEIRRRDMEKGPQSKEQEAALNRAKVAFGRRRGFGERHDGFAFETALGTRENTCRCSR